MLDKIERLFEEQIAAWPMLARGTEALKHVRTRVVDLNGFTVFIRHLPHRITSTTAAVDRDSVEKRPCFLCAANLPAEEKGLRFNSEFTIYCNPFPILERHMTIVHNEHRPQRIAGKLPHMIALAQALPGYVVIYNGPECGASAPDHLHFQACSAQGLPIIEDVKRAVGDTIPNYGRTVKLSRRVIDIPEPEPMLNLAAFRDADGVVLALFPRRKHRPEVFHTGELTVSPATIDLCGMVVAPVEEDFDRITGEDIRKIFNEVSGV
jgi:hypothetical protein